MYKHNGTRIQEKLNELENITKKLNLKINTNKSYNTWQTQGWNNKENRRVTIPGKHGNKQRVHATYNSLARNENQSNRLRMAGKIGDTLKSTKMAIDKIHIKKKYSNSWDIETEPK